MHKTVKEEIELDFQNLEVFYAVLTYFYTGQIAIDRNSVADLLHISDYFSVVKLRTYCGDYLLRTLNSKNVFAVIDMAIKYGLSDVQKQSMSFVWRNFNHLFDRPELLSMPAPKVHTLLSERTWPVPQEALLNFVTRWVAFHPSGLAQSREDSLIPLLQYVNWTDININFVCQLLDRDELYQNNPEALLSILYVIHDRNSLYLGPRFQEMYQSLQEKLLPPEQDLDELNDTNSFLSIAINSAVKDLEHSDVDPDWFLQNEPPTDSTYRPTGGPDNSNHTVVPIPSSSGGSTTAAPMLTPLATQSPASSAIPSQQQSQHHHHRPSGSGDRQEKYKDATLDFEIVDELISEQQGLCYEEKNKYIRDQHSTGTSSTTTTTKRYDPKFRALTEAFRQETDDGGGADEASMTTVGMSHTKYAQDEGGGWNPSTTPLPTESLSNREVPKLYKHPGLMALAMSGNMELYRNGSGYGGAAHYGSGGPVGGTSSSCYNNVFTQHHNQQQQQPPPPPQQQPQQQQGHGNGEVVGSTVLTRSTVEAHASQQSPGSRTKGDSGGLPPHLALDDMLPKTWTSSSTSSSSSPTVGGLTSGCGGSRVKDVAIYPNQHLHDQQHPSFSGDNNAATTNHRHPTSQSSAISTSSTSSYEGTHQSTKPRQLDVPVGSISSRQDFKFAVPDTPVIVAGKQISKADKTGTKPAEAVPQSSALTASSQDPSKVNPGQKEHVKKAKLLAEHRNLQEDVTRQNCKDMTEKPLSSPNVSSKTTNNTSEFDNNNDNDTNSKQVHQCKYCKYSTCVSQRMKIHIKQHENDDGKKEEKEKSDLYRCKVCDNFQTPRRKELSAHMRRDHFPEGPPFRCDLGDGACTYRTVKLSQLLSHRQTHSTVPGFKCKSCPFATRTANRLAIHMLQHDKKFPCPHCNKLFPSNGALKKHLVSFPYTLAITYTYMLSLVLSLLQILHEEVKMNSLYRCPECPFFATRYRSHLTLHSRVHSGTAHRCEVPGCSYATPKLSHLLAHRRAHNKEKLFTCATCGRGFVERSQLRRHERTVHSTETPFACTRCKFKTKRKDKLKGHLERVHSLKRDEKRNSPAAAAVAAAEITTAFLSQVKKSQPPPPPQSE